MVKVGRHGAERGSHGRRVGEYIEEAEDFAVFLGGGTDGCAVGGG